MTNPTPSPQPTNVRVRMYQVGFGDCFLVSLGYEEALEDGRDQRHILIDFGSTKRSEHGLPLDDVAKLIADHSGGRLDVVVLTHRHKDHLQGFGTTASADVIEGLAPGMVVRPWTEDPAAAEDATGPGSIEERSLEFARSLSTGQVFATALGEAIASERGIRGQLRQLALDQIANKAAVDRLDRWAQAGESAYTFFGSASRIEEFVPGVEVTVLGPPTVEQWPAVTGQCAEDPEYWMIHQRLLERALSESGLAEQTVERAVSSALRSVNVDPGPVRWLVAKMQRQQLSSLHRVVRTLDDALNNTSLILLLKVGDKRLLFPGDAQIENWSYALKEALSEQDRRELLGHIDLYKVGHHGSRNATPRSLFALWGDAPDPDRPITSLLSTLSGVHGESEATRVPRETLVAALERRTELHSTDGLDPTKRWVEVSASTSGESDFVVVD